MSLKAFEDLLVFKGVDKESLNNYLTDRPVITVDKGKYLFHQDEVGTAMYIVTDGALDIELKDEMGNINIIATVEAGSVLGEICMLTKQSRTSSVKAVEATQLIQLDSADFRNRVDDKDLAALRISFNIALTLAHRLERADILINTLYKKSQKNIQNEINEFKTRLLSEVGL